MWFSAADYVGASCILYPCIRCYAARIREGRLDESVVREVPLRQQPPIEPRTGTSKDSSDWQGVQTPCFVNDTLYTSFNMSKAADLAPDAVAGVQVHTIKDWTMDTDTSYANVTALVECIDELPETLVRAIQAEVRSTVNTSCVVPAQGSQLTCKNDGGYSQHLAELCSLGTASFESRRVSLEIRRYGKSAWTAELGFVEGETWEDRTCVRTAWACLALPATTLALCAVLLLWTVVAERGVLWKYSVLPFLPRGHDGLERMGVRGGGGRC